MLVVIFTAELATIDDQYRETAATLRKKAREEYGCLEFISVTEGNTEITLSYWQDENSLHHWKNDPEHVQAQLLGKEKWYRSFRVEIAELTRQYGDRSSNV